MGRAGSETAPGPPRMELCLPRAEDCRADSDVRGAFFDGYLEIAGHSHGERRAVGGRELLESVSQRLEVGAGEVWRGAVWSHAHESAQVDAFNSGDFRADVEARFEGD